MSALYPVPPPVNLNATARVVPLWGKVVFLPAAPIADVQLPTLIMAPMAPPSRGRA